MAPLLTPTPAPTRHRRHEDAPVDRELHVCECGQAWTAAVVTDVRCPHCGTEQAW